MEITYRSVIGQSFIYNRVIQNMFGDHSENQNQGSDLQDHLRYHGSEMTLQLLDGR